MANLYEEIGRKIRELRQNHPKGALSQGDLAKELRVPPNTISRWETGAYKIRPEDLEKLARLFSIPITTFFPRLPQQNERIEALTSATGGLDEKDFEEIIRYAEFRKARRAMEGKQATRAKN
jgi:transcriptional regulator with XRE-family HTH domain